MPDVMFAKAWEVTGHVSKEEYLSRGLFTEEQWSSCKLRVDPLEMDAVLGPENNEEPSIDDLIFGGHMKRRRVIWLLSEKHPSPDMAVMPACLVHPIEKRIASYLYAQADGRVPHEVKSMQTICISKRQGKECSYKLLLKHTVTQGDGSRAFKEDVPQRTLKAHADRGVVFCVYFFGDQHRWRNPPMIHVSWIVGDNTTDFGAFVSGISRSFTH